jgi:hypothetical protein
MDLNITLDKSAGGGRENSAVILAPGNPFQVSFASTSAMSSHPTIDTPSTPAKASQDIQPPPPLSLPTS